MESPIRRHRQYDILDLRARLEAGQMFYIFKDHRHYLLERHLFIAILEYVGSVDEFVALDWLLVIKGADEFV